MKSRDTINILGLSVILGMSLLGCSDMNTESVENPQSTVEHSSVDLSIPENSQDTESSEETENSEPKIPEGKPTIYTAPEGVPIYTSEITTAFNERGDPISPDEITADEESEIFCEGFQYFKEPIGFVFDSYHNPEMFNETGFIGDIPQNNKPFKRLYVGDEMCGLKLTKATTHFTNFDGEIKFNNTISSYSGNIAEFEGSVTLEGFLFITPPNNYEPEGGNLKFCPIEEKLPILRSVKSDDPTKCYEEPWTCYVVDGIYTQSEIGGIGFRETYSDINIDGIGIGDLALVRATISNFCYTNGGGRCATLEDIEVLSEVIKHVDSEI